MWFIGQRLSPKGRHCIGLNGKKCEELGGRAAAGFSYGEVLVLEICTRKAQKKMSSICGLSDFRPSNVGVLKGTFGQRPAAFGPLPGLIEFYRVYNSYTRIPGFRDNSRAS